MKTYLRKKFKNEQIHNECMGENKRCEKSALCVFPEHEIKEDAVC